MPNLWTNYLWIEGDRGSVDEAARMISADVSQFKRDDAALSQPSSIFSHNNAMLCTSTRSIISFFCRSGVRERNAEPKFRFIMLCTVSL